MHRKYTFTSADGQDMTAEITRFVEITGLDAVAPERYSMLLVMGLFGGFKSGMLNPAKVVHEIRALEGGEPSRLKPPIQNKHPPLKGLWHKHYLEDGIRAVATNVEKGLKRYGIPYFQQKIDEAREAGEERFMTADDLTAIANEVVHGHWQTLAENEALTGEWLVYAEHEGKKYYLCLATHDRQHHDSLRRQIDDVCCVEFPFLTGLLENA